MTSDESRMTLLTLARKRAEVERSNRGGRSNVERVDRRVHRNVESELSLLQGGLREAAAFIAEGQDGSQRKVRDGSDPRATFTWRLRCHQRATVLSEQAEILEWEDRQHQERAGSCADDLWIERIR